MTRFTLYESASISPMPSALRSGGGSVFSSTPGGALGDPLSATYSDLPSGDGWIPRGRLPSGAVAITAAVATSITVRLPAASLVTKTRTGGIGAAGADDGGAAAGASTVRVASLHERDKSNDPSTRHRCRNVMAGMIAQHRSVIFKTDASHVQVLFYLLNGRCDKRVTMHHDACGVGFIARISGEPGHDILRHGLTALVRLAHRGAPASLGFVDGCGLLTAIPWPVVSSSIAGRMPVGRSRALGMLFVHPSDRDTAVELVERTLDAAGASWAWRRVPTDPAAVLRAHRDTTPIVLQVVAAFPAGRQVIEATLFRTRLRLESAARTAGVRLAVVSLSSTTVVYKALTPPESLAQFYPDLADRNFATRFVVFHQRFSTNTTADWALAQPFRQLAHNGEINAIGGNRAWMRARFLDDTSLPGYAGEPVSHNGSDSRSLDDAVELMRSRGYSVAHALSRLMPPAWERDRDLAPDVRAFHEFQSLVSEPWDGPSALAFADGRFVGAALDRNGFRPARVVRTAADVIAVASEAGVLAASEHDIVDRDRLGPGDMLIVDLDRGAVMGTNEIRRRLAFRRRYRQLVANVVRPLSWDAEALADPEAITRAVPASSPSTPLGTSALDRS